MIMTKLAEFQSIKERDDVFDRTEITSFNNLLDALKDDQGKNVFFRGQASAKWRIFSSIQREWIQQDLERYHTNIDDLVSGFLKFCRKKLSVKIKAELKETNDVTVFSMLQHYGAPTPFVDFTSNPDVALYFAVDGNDFIKGDEIDNFFSIYVIEEGGMPETSSDNDLSSLGNILNASSQSFELLKAQAKCQDEINAFNAYDKSSEKNWECISTFPVILIKEDGIVNISNKRIDPQNGLFIFQGNNSVSSLETHFDSWTSEKVLDTCERQFLKKIKVYDVHKDVLNEAKGYLAAKKINKENLGLEVDEFGKLAFEEYLRELAK
jgi:hypothetical protein